MRSTVPDKGSPPNGGAAGASATERVPDFRLWMVLLLAVLLGLVGIFFHVQERGYRVRLANAATDTQRIALVLEEQTASVILRTDTILEHIADDIGPTMGKHPQSPAQLHQYLKKLLGRFPELTNIRVLGKDGCSVAAATDADSDTCYGDRSYFIRHRDTPALGLDISQPIFGRTSHGWQLMLSRRIDDAEGHFAGVVSARLALSYFEQFFESVHLGNGSSITLLSSDFHVITRYPMDESQRLKSVANGLIAKSSQHGATMGTISGASAVDGIERIYGFHRVGNYPLTIVVGLAQERVLAEWRKNAVIESIVLLGLLTAIAWLSHRLFRQLRAEQESRLRLREITVNMGEGLYVVDRNGIIGFVNPALCTLLGHAEQELVGRSAHRLFHHSKADGTPYPAETCPILGVIGNGVIHTSDDETYWRKDGTPIRASIVAAPILRQAEVAGAVITVQDISWRKEAEHQIHRLNETLEERVRDEVAKNLAQERLLVQQSRLAAMGEMIGNIAHQWRQPLNGLGILLANIQDAYEFGELDQQSLERTIGQGRGLINKMSSTIDDFRNFFKPNREKSAFRLETPVQETLELLEQSLKSLDIVVHLETDPGGVVYGFPNEFSQVVLNILSNAKDVIQERCVRKGEIHITLGHDADNAWLRITDNAGGIPADVLPRIFDPYFTTKDKGTGIGLYMSKIIIENHMGGSIEARSLPGGAEFTVTCPLSPAPRAAKEKPEETVAPPA